MLNSVSCAPVQEKITQLNSHHQLDRYRENLADGSFETAILNGRAVIEKSETSPPAEVALYALGEVYAHPEYYDMDYVLSQYYFEKLIGSLCLSLVFYYRASGVRY